MDSVRIPFLNPVRIDDSGSDSELYFSLVLWSAPARVPGLGQITWRIVLTKKMRGHEGEIFGQKSRKIEN